MHRELVLLPAHTRRPLPSSPSLQVDKWVRKISKSGDYTLRI